MATWEQIETDLTAIFAELLGIPCDWRAKSRQMTTGARAQVDYLTGSALGIDEPVMSDWPSALPTSIATTVYGLREFVLQVSVESWTQSLATSARAYLETLRTRLRLPSVLVRLAALGLSVVAIEQTVQLDRTQDGRVVSSAAMDLRFAHGVSESDALIPYIETVRITSPELGVDVTVPEP
jgi:hypothetical protein